MGECEMEFSMHPNASIVTRDSRPGIATREVGRIGELQSYQARFHNLNLCHLKVMHFRLSRRSRLLTSNTA